MFALQQHRHRDWGFRGDGSHGGGCIHPGVELRANLKSISHGCHLFEVAFAWALTTETIRLPLGCLQGGRWLGWGRTVWAARVAASLVAFSLSLTGSDVCVSNIVLHHLFCVSNITLLQLHLRIECQISSIVLTGSDVCVHTYQTSCYINRY